MAPSTSAGDDGRQPERGPLDIDAILDVLRDRRRRLVLEHCMDRSKDVHEFDDLVNSVYQRLAREDEPVERDRLEASLHHVHLPFLVERGLLEYDHRSGQLRYRPDRQVERWLERIQAADAE